MITSTVALLAAAVITIAVVLPAEFAMDPLGSGAWLGLTGLSNPTAEVRTSAEQPHRIHDRSFRLSPYEFVEFKYQLESGTALLYAWQASGEVVFDFHGHPSAYSDEGAMSYNVGRDQSDAGTFVAPFTGVHGWYWENRGATDILIDLESAGYYDLAIEWRDTQVNEIDLSDF